MEPNVHPVCLKCRLNANHIDGEGISTASQAPWSSSFRGITLLIPPSLKSNEEAHVHHAGRKRGGRVAAGGARAASRADAAHRRLKNVGDGEWSAYCISVAVARNSRLVT